jgi:hypothetical protein
MKYICEYVVDMPKIARIDTPGLLHHVIIRGIERRKIFDDDFDTTPAAVSFAVQRGEKMIMEGGYQL